MSPLENHVWKRMLDARMNKYYHQASVRYLSLLNSGANIVALVALALAGFAPSLGIEARNLQWVMLAAALFPLVVVLISVPAKIAHHESLFHGFNEVETRLALFNRMFDRGEGDAVKSEEIDRIESDFRNLEAKQPHPSQILLRYCDGRVRAEVGEVVHYWPLPIFREKRTKQAA
jgi:hypothetical protein